MNTHLYIIYIILHVYVFFGGICMHLWDTLGAQVALNLAPLLHRTFPLALRAEVGVSGFVALDLFRMLAEDQCRKMKAPTGSTFWAAQTVVNMQSCCLAGILVTITKDEAFSPWRAGSARMSEISIEEQFSFLRRQSANAQLTCRSFWQAAARVAISTGRKLNKEQPAPVQGEKPLGMEEFLLDINTFL